MPEVFGCDLFPIENACKLSQVCICKGPDVGGVLGEIAVRPAAIEGVRAPYVTLSSVQVELNYKMLSINKCVPKKPGTAKHL